MAFMLLAKNIPQKNTECLGAPFCLSRLLFFSFFPFLYFIFSSFVVPLAKRKTYLCVTASEVRQNDNFHSIIVTNNSHLSEISGKITRHLKALTLFYWHNIWCC